MAHSRSLTSQLYRPARTANTISAVTSGDPKRIVRRSRSIVIGQSLGRAGVWRRLWRREGPRTSSEMRERLAAREAEKARQENINATILAAHGGRCAACGEAPRYFRCDGYREKVLCRPCYRLIEDARALHGAPEPAAKWLRAAAQYLTTTEGGE
jgi:hypothetical protein